VISIKGKSDREMPCGGLDRGGGGRAPMVYKEGGEGRRGRRTRGEDVQQKVS